MLFPLDSIGVQGPHLQFIYNPQAGSSRAELRLLSAQMPQYPGRRPPRCRSAHTVYPTAALGRLTALQELPSASHARGWGLGFEELGGGGARCTRPSQGRPMIRVFPQNSAHAGAGKGAQAHDASGRAGWLGRWRREPYPAPRLNGPGVPGVRGPGPGPGHERASPEFPSRGARPRPSGCPAPLVMARLADYFVLVAFGPHPRGECRGGALRVWDGARLRRTEGG